MTIIIHIELCFLIFLNQFNILF